MTGSPSHDEPAYVGAISAAIAAASANPLEPMLWTRVLDQLSRIEGRLIHGDMRFDNLQEIATRLDTRIGSLEEAWRRERLHRRLPCWANAFCRVAGVMREIATPREWVTGAVVVSLALNGIIAPEVILKFFSLE
jgi:predicted acylesterase/phospholipase RssA